MPVGKGNGSKNGFVDRMGQREGPDVDGLQGIAGNIVPHRRHDDGILRTVLPSRRGN